MTMPEQGVIRLTIDNYYLIILKEASLVCSESPKRPWI